MIGIIIQARTKSTRFPNKIYEDLNGKTTLYRTLESATKNDLPHKIILVMPEFDEKEFNIKFDAGEFEGAVDDRFCTYFGDPDDLVDRYYGAANKYGIDLIVRLTSDCPFGGIMVDEMLCEYLKNEYNGFMGNNEAISELPYPNGCDVEVFNYTMLSEAKSSINDPYELEHCTPYFYRKDTQYQIHQFNNSRPHSMISMKHPDFSFDTKQDKIILLKICKEYDKLDLNKFSAVERLNIALGKIK